MAKASAAETDLGCGVRGAGCGGPRPRGRETRHSVAKHEYHDREEKLYKKVLAAVLRVLDRDKKQEQSIEQIEMALTI